MSVVTIERKVLQKNDTLAAANRERFAHNGLLVLNIVSSPGAGKTTLLEATIEQLRDRARIVVGSGAIQQLEQLLGVKATTPPILFSSSELSGRVKNGFSLPLGGSVTLYGFSDDRGIPVLGANVGEHPDDLKLTNAFMKLNSNKGLILVDWRAQVVLVSVDKSGQINVWRP